MHETLEDREDVDAIHEFRRKLAAGEEELVPAGIVDRILEGENRVRVWREHRGISARDLALKAVVSAGLLSQIEAGLSYGSKDAVRRIAAVLGISSDDLG